MEIIDNSNDKKYFTQVPNFILNHSTAIDQALYLQMKRITGEKNKCKAGEKYFCKQLGIGRKNLQKSLQYLIEHKWIEKIGKEKIETAGGKQGINCYIVNDIWKMNIDYYSKGVSERTPHKIVKGVSERTQRGVRKDIKGVSERDNKEEQFKKNKNLLSASADKVLNSTVNDIINSMNSSSDQQDKNTEIFNSKSAIENTINDKQKHIQVVGIYWKWLGWNFENKEQYQSALGRDLKPASALKGYSLVRIKKTFKKLDRDSNNGEKFAWNLNTVHKTIDNIK